MYVFFVVLYARARVRSFVSFTLPPPRRYYYYSPSKATTTAAVAPRLCTPFVRRARPLFVFRSYTVVPPRIRPVTITSTARTHIDKPRRVRNTMVRRESHWPRPVLRSIVVFTSLSFCTFGPEVSTTYHHYRNCIHPQRNRWVVVFKIYSTLSTHDAALLLSSFRQWARVRYAIPVLDCEYTRTPDQTIRTFFPFPSLRGVDDRGSSSSVGDSPGKRVKVSRRLRAVSGP